MDKVERIQFTKEERQKILNKTNCKCAHCGAPLETATMTVEHIYPINKGGDNSEYNLVALCKKCNNEKSNFTYCLRDYYFFITDDELYKYEAYNMFLAHKNLNESIIEYSRLTYSLILDGNKKILYNMIKRKASPKKIREMQYKLTSLFRLEKAYPGDATEIMDVINRARKGTRLNLDLYTNEYQVLNDIKSGEAYVLRANNKIYGAFAFRKLNNNFNIDIPQLNNMEECCKLRKRFIMTLAVLDRQVGELLPDIMSDLQNRLIISKSIPIYFNILTNCYKETDTIIKMPYTLDGINGTLEFMPIQHIREVCVEGYMRDIDRMGITDCTEEDVTFYIDYEVLYDKSELTEDEHDRLDRIVYLMSGKDETYKELRRLMREDRLKNE